MRKPECITSQEVFFDYYFTMMIEEQKKTNKLLDKLLSHKEVEPNVELGILEEGRKRKLGSK